MPTFETLTGILLDQELRSADSTVLFTSTRRNQAVNDGYADFCELTECLVRVSTVTVSCNTARYNLLSSATLGSTDFVRLAPRGVEFHLLSSHGGSSARLTQLAGDDFPRRDIEWLNKYEPGWRQSTTPQTPTGYYIDESSGGFVLGLDRNPDVGSSEAAQLVIPYIARPAPMTSTGDVPFTIGSNTRHDLTPFHQAIVHYAAHQLEKLRGDEQASDRQYAKYLAYVQRFTEKVRKRGGAFVSLAKNYLKDARRVSGVSAVPRRDHYSSWP
ncbi:MAG TPA: hypothetical protein VEA16_15160 [Vicinamibacterales bacterium]|nr:hypothetical protein [Vicinamibacterales bacterium]